MPKITELVSKRSLNPLLCPLDHVPRPHTNCLHIATEFAVPGLAQSKHFMDVSSYHDTPEQLQTGDPGSDILPRDAMGP